MLITNEGCLIGVRIEVILVVQVVRGWKEHGDLQKLFSLIISFENIL